MRIKEKDMPQGTLYAYDGYVSIDEHIAGLKEPALILHNMIPTVGRTHILNNGVTGIDTVCLGDSAAARALTDTDLKSLQFSASATDTRLSGAKWYTQIYLPTTSANFTHREIGIKDGTVLISTLVIDPAFTKDASATRTYIHELGW